MREMNTKTQLDDAALRYHSEGHPGKIGIVPTKPYHTQYDLSLAYSPGVAAPSLAIAEEPDDVYKYTGKGNLVAVISNGTAVLGLGNIGPLAAKPVMEGKSMLFKTYAGIDAFDVVWSDVNDEAGFLREVDLIRKMGFNGKSLINPRQIDLLHNAYAPTQEEVDHARRVIEAAEEGERNGLGVVSLNGKMVDAPIINHAQVVLERAAASGVRR